MMPHQTHRHFMRNLQSAQYIFFSRLKSGFIHAIKLCWGVTVNSSMSVLQRWLSVFWLKFDYWNLLIQVKVLKTQDPFQLRARHYALRYSTLAPSCMETGIMQAMWAANVNDNVVEPCCHPILQAKMPCLSWCMHSYHIGLFNQLQDRP